MKVQENQRPSLEARLERKANSSYRREIERTRFQEFEVELADDLGDNKHVLDALHMLKGR